VAVADDLKPMLMKVCAGKKKYHFAYGTGKRKDGKGEGELIVSKKKPKREEVEEACECKDFLVGRCWSSPDGAIVYFQATGKKLSNQLVTKMALTAKRVIGKSYDFQLPSPEEEARASALPEGDEEDDAPPAAPPPPAAPKADPGAAFMARLKALMPAIKAAVTHPQGEQIKLRSAEAGTHANRRDFAQAHHCLDEVERLLKQPPPPAAGGSIPAAVAAEIAKPGVVARLVERTGRAAAARPEAPPKAALTNDLLATARETSPPARAEDFPDHLAQLAPKFLMAIESELSQQSQGLQSGAALPAQDQMLGLADLFDAAQRSLRAWQACLTEAHEADGQLDQLDKSKEDRDERGKAEYSAALVRYNTARVAGLKEQERTLKLAHALQAEYKALQAAQAKA
jgi:hypothetical protein